LSTSVGPLLTFVVIRPSSAMAASPSAAAAATSPSVPAVDQASVPVSSAFESPEAGEGGIEADPATDDAEISEAETQSLRSTSTASLSESIIENRRILGRTYTQKTDYWGPNDQKQNEGLDLAHLGECMFFDDKLCLAPIGDKPQKVLDLGTGTGIWAIDFADDYPSAEVTGIDISPIQPEWVPPNCKVQIDDFEEDWTWPPNYFDYIHVRHLEACVSDWPRLYSQAFEHLKPGGYIESQRFGNDLPKDHIYRRWAKIIFEATDKLGKTAKQTRDHGIANGLREAGFIDVIENRWAFPIGGWALDPKLKDVGAINLEYLDQGLEGFGIFLLKRIMDWEDAEILVFISEMRKAHLVYARKPEETEEPGEQADTGSAA
ncbi:umta protein, partial [Colletotrichum incanum]